MAAASGDDGTRDGGLLGRAPPRIEDKALLTGRGRFADDLAMSAATAEAGVLRSPHPHAEILAVDARAAEAMDGVYAVLTGADVAAWSEPFIVGLRQPMRHWCLAVERARYVGEPVAVVVARDRYLAEDAAEAVRVQYRPLAAVVEPLAALAADAPVLHPEVGANLVHDRSFRYGEPEEAFARAPHRLAVEVDYPRNACTPIEGFVVTAEDRGDDGYEVTANFQGPYTLHPVMARALKVPGNRLRLKTPPDSGGSFGVKQAVFPCIVAMALAARKAGRPVRWVEDRLEHLSAATSATNRWIRLEAAVEADGRISALDWDQVEDCGAYLRAPEPATLYRMHGNLTGAYDIRHVRCRNRVVLSNKTPSGLNRGFGGPQLYFALERLLQRIARDLGLDPLQVIRRNLVPTSAFPYRTASGSLLDSGDYEGAVDRAVAEGGLRELRQRRAAARAEGRLYGIGLAAVVEPSISNMGYITSLLTPQERARAGPKDGAIATASVSVDPSGAVGVSTASVPQGQGHRTVLAQVVAERLGLAIDEVAVTAEHDTAKDAWSIASGNYSSRFAGAVAGAAEIAATRLRERLARAAAAALNLPPERLAFGGSRIFDGANPENGLAFRRVAGLFHWSPGSVAGAGDAGLRETAQWNLPELAPPDEADRINSSGAYGFVFDFCGVEIDRTTGQVRVDKYVTMHDAGRLLHPAMADGQVLGGFAHGLGAALYERLAYDTDGNFLSGSFADYLVPGIDEVPLPIILHQETPSPFTPLGAKGIGEGNAMSTPVCLANAVADALDVDDVALPMTSAKLAASIHGPEPDAPGAGAVEATGSELAGQGRVLVAAPVHEVWTVLVVPELLAQAVSGCESIVPVAANAYRGEASFGVGPVRGRFSAEVRFDEIEPLHRLAMSGTASGPLGDAQGSGTVRLTPTDGGTEVDYDYRVRIGGKVAAIGGRMLEGAAKSLTAEFFRRLSRLAAVPPPEMPEDFREPWWHGLLRLFGWKQ